MRFTVTRVLFASILVMGGCKYHIESELYEGGCVFPPQISFASDVMPLISTNCAKSGCHVEGGDSPMTLLNYAEVKAIVDNGLLIDRVINEQDMPPVGPLGQCQMRLFEKWIENGAPNN